MAQVPSPPALCVPDEQDQRYEHECSQQQRARPLNRSQHYPDGRRSGQHPGASGDVSKRLVKAWMHGCFSEPPERDRGPSDDSRRICCMNSPNIRHEGVPDISECIRRVRQTLDRGDSPRRQRGYHHGLRRPLSDLPRRRHDDWVLDDPAGLRLPAVRPVRDKIERRVRALVAQLDLPVAAEN